MMSASTICAVYPTRDIDRARRFSYYSCISAGLQYIFYYADAMSKKIYFLAILRYFPKKQS